MDFGNINIDALQGLPLETLINLFPSISPEELVKKFHSRQPKVPITKKTLKIENIDKAQVPHQEQRLTELHKLYNQIIDFADRFNEIFTPTIEADATAFHHTLADSVTSQLDASRHFIKDGDGAPLGVLHPSTREGILNKLESMFTDQWGRVVFRQDHTFRELLAGVMQSGKTGNFAGLFLMLPVIIYVMTKGRIKPICLLNVPPYSSVLKNTIKEIKAAKELYGKLVFRNEDFSCDINHYWDEIVNNSKRSHATRAASLEDLIQSLVVLRTTSGLKKSRKQLVTWYQAGFEMQFIFTDECHWGSNTKGIQDEMTKALDLEGQGDEA